MKYNFQICHHGGGASLSVSAASIGEVIEHIRDFDKSQRPEYTVRQEEANYRRSRASFDSWVVRNRDGDWCGSFRNQKHADYYAEGLNEKKFKV